MSAAPAGVAKVVLFDLGNTLEHDDVPLPGALETLGTLAELRDAEGRQVALALVSDFDMPGSPAELPGIQRQYYEIIEKLGIRAFFEPVRERVTLSSEVGVYKPAPAVFQAALRKIGSSLVPADAVFVSEDRAHVSAASALGMRGVHFKGPGQTTGEIVSLLELVPIVRQLLAAPAPTTRSGAPGAWVRLGDQLLVLGAGEPEPAAAVSERVLARRHTEAEADRLFLVVQTGRMFQREHPDVSVIVDKGRYLVVELGPAHRQRVGTGAEACYSVAPLPLGTAVLDAPAPRRAPAARLSWVEVLVESLSGERFEADLRRLAGFPTRFSTSPDFDAAARWAKAELAALGYPTRLEPITVNGAPSSNVIADRAGRGADPRGLILLTAHLDSINTDGPAAPAPGADDNASGSAGLLAVARTFADHVAEYDLRLVLFGGEEEGLHGSRQYVQSLLAPERARIRAVVNMDMIATRNVEPRAVLLEGAALSQAVIDGLADAAATYTTLAVQTSLHAANSDHVPFLRAGLPAVLTIEGTDSANDHVHTAADTLDFIDPDLALGILRMNVAFLAQWLGRGA